MDRRIEDDVEGWPTRPIEGGHDGLRELASADFSGAVRAGGTTLFLLNGRIVGVFDGALEDFEDADGTAHKAPHRSLPLLYAMQEQGGETRAKYYTNDTPISEVDDTLSDGGFTGYVELSENVLSGDYYVVYHAGRAMSLAFVGNSERLVTGDEAFELADDEVGIYEVRDIDLDVRDVPSAGDADGSTASAGAYGAQDAGGAGSAAGGSSGDAGGAASDAPGGGSSGQAADADVGGAADPDAGEAIDDAGSEAPGDGATDPAGEHVAERVSSDDPPRDPGDGAAAGADPAPEDSPVEEAEPSAPASDRRDSGDDAGAGATGTARSGSAEGSGPDAPDPGSDAPASGTDAGRTAGSADRSAPRSEADATSDRDGGTSTGRAAAGGSTAGTTDARSSGGGAGVSGSPGPGAAYDDAEVLEDEPTTAGEVAWQEATAIPSLDPDRSAAEAPTATAPSGGGSATATRERSDGDRTASRRRSREPPEEGVDDTFEEEVLEREDRIDRLEQHASNLEEERDELAAERDRLATELEELEEDNEALRAEVRRLEREIEELEAARAGATAGDQADAPASGGSSGSAQTLAPRTALEGTDLFVRYDSKSEPTLEEVHDGAAEAAVVNENLRLDLHTRFDAEEATVEGEPFRAFLEETMGYRFVEWLVRVLPYEIRNTGQQSALRDLYDALPEVDRVEFDGTVELSYEEGGEQITEEETFDVVVRDRMGEPLVVANLNDSREPATDRMLLDLHEGASRVKETNAALAGAFFVTRSFFKPEALETASEATSGSLLSRDSRRSYVKLSRKQGYHVCLVEARGDDLHLNVPEL